MARKLTRRVTQTIHEDLDDKTELRRLRELIGEHLEEAPVPEGYRKKGDIMRVTAKWRRRKFVVGQLVVAKQGGAPDGERGYLIWFMDRTGKLDSGWIGASSVELYDPDNSAPVEAEDIAVAPKRRKLDMAL